MTRNVLLLIVICSTFIAKAQNFSLSYPFTNVVLNSSGLIDPTPAPTAAGVTSGSFTAVGTPSLNPNAGTRFSFVGWPLGGVNGVDTYTSMTGSINSNEYYELVLTTQPGYTMALNTLTFTVQRSGTGIRNYAVRTSLDGFTNNLPASVTTNTILSVVGANQFFWNLDANSSAQNGSTINFYGTTITNSVSLRFYGWNAELSGGTFSIDNVLINGTAYSSTVACNPPVVWAINGNSAICPSQSLNVSSAILGSAPYTYTWSGAGTLSSVNSASTSISSVTASNYTLNVSNACGTASSVITTTLNSLPNTLAITGNSIICSNQTLNLASSLSGTAPFTYTWSGAGTIGSVNSSSTTINNAASGDYTLSVSNACGTASSVVTATINPSPTLTVNSASICSSSSASLTASGATIYSWSPSIDLNTSTGSSVIATPSVSTVYSIVGTIGTCSSSATSSVTVNATPTITVNSATICSGNSTNLIAIGATSYSWSPANYLSSTSGSTVIATPLSTSEYTVVGTTGLCSSSASSSITVNVTPTITVNSATICYGNSANLVANGATSYNWSPSVDLNTSTGSSVIATPSVSTVYSIVGAIGTCSSSATSSVTVNATPTITVNSATICSGNSANLTANGATSYSWSPANVLNAIAGSTVEATPMSTTEYTVVGITGLCSSTATSSVTVNATPTITVNSATICSGSSATIIANGATSYSWTPANNLSATSGSTVDATPLSTTEYTVIGTTGLCSSSASSSITVNVTPTITVNSATICSGSSATIIANGATSYSWSPGNNLSATSGSTVDAAPLSTTEYTVIGTTGLCSSSATTSVTVNSTPTITVNSATICSGSSATLTANGASTYTWVSPASNNLSVVVNPTSTSIYTINGEVTGCISTATANVFVYALPTISVSVINPTVCIGNQVSLTASGASTYSWTGGVLNGVAFTPSVSANYSVIGMDTNGCLNTGTSSIVVNNLPVVTLNTNSINPQCVTINSVTILGGAPIGGVYSGNGVTSGVFSPASVGIGTYTITYTYTDVNSCINSASNVVLVSACTSIETLSTNNISVYPNPSNGEVIIKTPILNAEVMVFDLYGKNVYSQTTSTLQTQMDLSNLANGIYQITIVVDGNLFNYKMMISK